MFWRSTKPWTSWPKWDERKAKVVELCYFGGMSREEVAAALNPTLPTVPAAERGCFLAVACAGDDGMRREVERLLVYDQSKRCSGRGHFRCSQRTV